MCDHPLPLSLSLSSLSLSLSLQFFVSSCNLFVRDFQLGTLKARMPYNWQNTQKIVSFEINICIPSAKQLKALTSKYFFFLSYSPLIITPLWWGPNPIRVSSYLGLLHSSQLLYCWLSLIADSVS